MKIQVRKKMRFLNVNFIKKINFLEFLKKKILKMTRKYESDLEISHQNLNVNFFPTNYFQYYKKTFYLSVVELKSEN